LNVNTKSEAQQKKIKTVRGSDTDLDLSIHVRKGPKNLMRHSLSGLKHDYVKRRSRGIS
jgi:hypothetical protein